nr:hypothetical protein L204_00332 [Cryptococcus depauperatus CBS 7855]
MKLHSFITTHQPVIWMGSFRLSYIQQLFVYTAAILIESIGELGQAEIAPGPGKVVIDFDVRDMYFKREEESASPNYYRNLLSVKMVEREGQDIVSAEKVV